MLRDSYAKDKVFAEILQLVPKMEPGLAKISQYLEDEELFQLIRADFSKRWKNTLLTGRNSTPVEVVLRMLVVKRLYQYSYEETERIVSDSLTLRQFCRLYLNEAPDSKTLPRLTTAHWSFVYPLYLTGIYAVTGYHPLVARFVQGVLGGTLICFLVYRIDRQDTIERYEEFGRWYIQYP